MWSCYFIYTGLVYSQAFRKFLFFLKKNRKDLTGATFQNLNLFEFHITMINIPLWPCCRKDEKRFLVGAEQFIPSDSYTAATRYNMTMNSFFNKYTFFPLSQLPNWLALPSNLQYPDKIVKSRSFGVEDLRIEDRLWQRARRTRRQTDLLWIRLSDSVTNLSGCLIWCFTLVCANIWLP